MSNLPKRLTVSATSRSTSSQRLTSVRIKNASPARLIWLAACSPRSLEYSPSATVAPSRANAVAMARPLPEPAPVTTATRPSSLAIAGPVQPLGGLLEAAVQDARVGRVGDQLHPGSDPALGLVEA